MLTKCLELAEKLAVLSIAFPAIGTGLLRYPPEDTAKCFYDAAVEFARKHPKGCLKMIKLVVYTEDSFTKKVRCV